MIRRINIYGGPGVGKSTLAARIFARMKQRGDNVELVQEFVKQFAYSGERVIGWNCVYAFAKQLKAEQKLLENGVDIIVTDSPLLLQCIYARVNNCVVTTELKKICSAFDREYLSFDVFVKRNNVFISEGRFETEKEAIAMDYIIKKFLGNALEVNYNISSGRLMRMIFNDL